MVRLIHVNKHGTMIRSHMPVVAKELKRLRRRGSPPGNFLQASEKAGDQTREKSFSDEDARRDKHGGL